MSFGIRADYIENPKPAYYLDDVPGERGITFQPDVYTLTEYLGFLDEAWRLESYSGDVPIIVDVGAGWGDKLAAMHDRRPKWKYVLVDYGANLAHCRVSYPWASCWDGDFETITELPIPSGAIVVCSDVIEHLVDPTAMLDALRVSDAEAIVLSTPERNVEHGWGNLGPPPNACHVREWTAEELNGYLTGVGFTILHHGLTRGNDQGWAMGTQLVVMKP